MSVLRFGSPKRKVYHSLLFRKDLDIPPYDYNNRPLQNMQKFLLEHILGLIINENLLNGQMCSYSQSHAFEEAEVP